MRWNIGNTLKVFLVLGNWPLVQSILGQLVWWLGSTIEAVVHVVNSWRLDRCKAIVKLTNSKPYCGSSSTPGMSRSSGVSEINGTPDYRLSIVPPSFVLPYCAGTVINIFFVVHSTVERDTTSREKLDEKRSFGTTVKLFEITLGSYALLISSVYKRRTSKV